MDEEQRQHLRDFLRTHQRRLRALEQQAALQGVQTPPQVVIEIEDLKGEIADIEAHLSALPAQTPQRRSEKGEVERAALAEEALR
jgi:hypothetical protein